MLLVAGLLEGFGRQLITGDVARYAIGVAMLLPLVRSISICRGGRAHG